MFVNWAAWAVGTAGGEVAAVAVEAMDAREPHAYDSATSIVGERDLQKGQTVSRTAQIRANPNQWVTRKADL